MSLPTKAVTQMEQHCCLYLVCKPVRAEICLLGASSAQQVLEVLVFFCCCSALSNSSSWSGQKDWKGLLLCLEWELG